MVRALALTLSLALVVGCDGQDDAGTGRPPVEDLGTTQQAASDVYDPNRNREWSTLVEGDAVLFHKVEPHGLYMTAALGPGPMPTPVFAGGYIVTWPVPGPGDGDFKMLTEFPVVKQQDAPSRLQAHENYAVGDVNADGQDDVVVAHDYTSYSDTRKYSFFTFARKQGRFIKLNEIEVPRPVLDGLSHTRAEWFWLEDVDKDGRDEIISIANQANGWLNTSSVPVGTVYVHWLKPGPIVPIPAEEEMFDWKNQYPLVALDFVTKLKPSWKIKVMGQAETSVDSAPWDWLPDPYHPTSNPSGPKQTDLPFHDLTPIEVDKNGATGALITGGELFVDRSVTPNLGYRTAYTLELPWIPRKEMFATMGGTAIAAMDCMKVTVRQHRLPTELFKLGTPVFPQVQQYKFIGELRKFGSVLENYTGPGDGDYETRDMHPHSERTTSIFWAHPTLCGVYVENSPNRKEFLRKPRSIKADLRNLPNIYFASYKNPPDPAPGVERPEFNQGTGRDDVNSVGSTNMDLQPLVRRTPAGHNRKTRDYHFIAAVQNRSPSQVGDAVSDTALGILPGLKTFFPNPGEPEFFGKARYCPSTGIQYQGFRPASCWTDSGLWSSTSLTHGDLLGYRRRIRHEKFHEMKHAFRKPLVVFSPAPGAIASSSDGGYARGGVYFGKDVTAMGSTTHSHALNNGEGWSWGIGIDLHPVGFIPKVGKVINAAGFDFSVGGGHDESHVNGTIREEQKTNTQETTFGYSYDSSGGKAIVVSELAHKDTDEFIAQAARLPLGRDEDGVGRVARAHKKRYASGGAGIDVRPVVDDGGLSHVCAMHAQGNYGFIPSFQRKNGQRCEGIPRVGGHPETYIRDTMGADNWAANADGDPSKVQPAYASYDGESLSSGTPPGGDDRRAWFQGDDICCRVAKYGDPPACSTAQEIPCRRCPTGTASPGTTVPACHVPDNWTPGNWPATPNWPTLAYKRGTRLTRGPSSVWPDGDRAFLTLQVGRSFAFGRTVGTSLEESHTNHVRGQLKVPGVSIGGQWAPRTSGEAVDLGIFNESKTNMNNITVTQLESITVGMSLAANYRLFEIMRPLKVLATDFDTGLKKWIIPRVPGAGDVWPGTAPDDRGRYARVNLWGTTYGSPLKQNGQSDWREILAQRTLLFVYNWFPETQGWEEPSLQVDPLMVVDFVMGVGSAGSNVYAKNGAGQWVHTPSALTHLWPVRMPDWTNQTLQKDLSVCPSGQNDPATCPKLPVYTSTDAADLKPGHRYCAQLYDYNPSGTNPFAIPGEEVSPFHRETNWIIELTPGPDGTSVAGGFVWAACLNGCIDLATAFQDNTLWGHAVCHEWVHTPTGGQAGEAWRTITGWARTGTSPNLNFGVSDALRSLVETANYYRGGCPACEWSGEILDPIGTAVERRETGDVKGSKQRAGCGSAEIRKLGFVGNPILPLAAVQERKRPDYCLSGSSKATRSYTEDAEVPWSCVGNTLYFYDDGEDCGAGFHCEVNDGGQSGSCVQDKDPIIPMPTIVCE